MADLQISDLTVALDGRPVLVSCTGVFPGGRRAVLWGPSGAGKSTLLATIAGLLRPANGEIALGERLLFSTARGVDLAPHSRRIGFVFQDLALWPHLTAVAQVKLAGAAVGLGRDGARDLLFGVGIGSLADRRPGKLSGGEQQRLAIARALACEPEILLLDEPFSSVDPGTRAALRELLRNVSPRIPGPTIYVTHEVADARELAESVARLNGGRLTQGGLESLPAGP